MTSKSSKKSKSLFFIHLKLKLENILQNLSTTQSQSGYYIYINAASPRQPNDAARILSPFVKISQSIGGCFKFYYHMFGPDIFRLNLYAKNNTGNAYGKAILQKQSNKGDRWILGHVFVENRQNEDIRFIIEAIVKIFKKY